MSTETQVIESNTKVNNIELNSTDKKDYEILPDEYNYYDFSFKTIIIGDTGVGKSCLSSKGVKDFFPINQKSTVGFEYSNFTIKLNNSVVKLNIWDTCGQEAYKSMVANFFRNSSLAILTYAIDNRNSFDLLENWLKDLRINCNPDVKVFLIGNKSDLLHRQVNKEDALKFKEDNKIDYFIEASAKTGENVENIFVNAARILLTDYLSYLKISNDVSRKNSAINKNNVDNPNNTNFNGIYKNDKDPRRGSFLLNAKAREDRDKTKKGSCSC